MLDIFTGNQFSVVQLTEAINKPIFQPGRIGSLGIFRESGITTTTVVLEEKGGVLKLIPPTPRGAPGVTLPKPKALLRSLVVPHFEINDAIMAEEVQGVRQFGSETAVADVQGVIANRMIVHRQSHEVTLEYARVGAIIGVVTYADGSTLDLFTETGVTPEVEINFDLSNAAPANGALRKKCAAVIRTMSKNLDGIPYSGINAICGDAFFDDLLANIEITRTFLNNPMASQLRAAYISNGQTYGSFDFGGISWENYRGYVGGVEFVNTDKAHFFPVGVPNLFRTYFAPADYNETVNTRGQKLYLKQYQMPNDKGANLDSQMNALNICTRPKVLMKGRRT